MPSSVNHCHAVFRWGRSHSKFGFYECVNIKLVTWEPGHTRNFWWHPYDETLGEYSLSGVLVTCVVCRDARS